MISAIEKCKERSLKNHLPKRKIKLIMDSQEEESTEFPSH
jgi:hypothetical protein